MVGRKIQIRRSVYGEDIPATEHLGVGQLTLDPDRGSIGMGCGEQNPRYLPGIDLDTGALVLHEGQVITSKDNPGTSIGFENGKFVVTKDGNQILVISDSADVVFDSVQITEKFTIKAFESVNYGTEPGFQFINGKMTFTCPVDFLGALNLSLQDFADAILPTEFNPGDVLVAGSLGSSSHSWKEPGTLLKNLSKMAPTLYKATSPTSSRTLDFKFNSEPSFFAMNSNKKGAFDDDLKVLLTKFGGSYSRASTGLYYNRYGQLTQAGVDQPRYDYDPFTGRNRGLLIEPESQNNNQNSSVMTSNWETNSVSLLQVTRPAWTNIGLANPYSVSEQSTGEHYYQKSYANVPKSKIVTVSKYVEVPADGSAIRFQFYCFDTALNKAGVTAVVSTNSNNLATLQAGNGALLKKAFKQITSTIFRIGITVILDSTSTTNQTFYERVQLLDAAGLSSYSGNRTAIFYTNDSQMEYCDRMTSYMPTVNGVASRKADLFSLNLENIYYDVYKNFLGLRFLLDEYRENDPIFSLYSQGFSASLRVGNADNLILDKGPTGSAQSTVVAPILDFITYELDCTGLPNTVKTLNIGSNTDQSKFMTGWVNLINLNRN